jgi:hypothetical protein
MKISDKNIIYNKEYIMATATTFDPDLGVGNLQFKCTDLRVIDPAGTPPSTGSILSQSNHVLNPDKEFKIEVDWEGAGWLLALWMNAMSNNWVIKAYAETVGPGPDIALAVNSLEPVGNPATIGSNHQWTHTLTVPAGVLTEGNPGSQNSGIYKISVTVFANSKLPGGYDVSGFAQKSITVRAEVPA